VPSFFAKEEGGLIEKLFLNGMWIETWRYGEAVPRHCDLLNGMNKGRVKAGSSDEASPKPTGRETPSGGRADIFGGGNGGV